MIEPHPIDALVERKPTLSCPKCGNPVDVSAVEAFDAATCADCGARFSVPVKFGQFLLVRPVAHDAATRTFRARDRALAREVLIQIIVGEAIADAGLIQRTHDDAGRLAALNHPNVGKVYSVGEHEGAPYIVMERLTGEPLDRLVNDDGVLDESTALRIGADIADGLAHAHAAGLLHGDIRPGNIWIGDDGVARIGGFVVGQWVDDRYRVPRMSLHPHCVAPELLDGDPPTVVSDVFALGASLFYAVVGRDAFVGEEAAGILDARRYGSPDLRDIDVNYQTAAADALARLMATDPRHRDADMAVASVNLRNAADSIAPEQHEVAETDEPSDSTQDSEEPLPPKRSRTILLLSLAGAFAIAVAVTLIIVLSSGGEPAGQPVTPVSDTFDGSDLDAAWKPVGGGGALNGDGQLQLRHPGSGGLVGVERIHGARGCDASLHVSKINLPRFWSGKFRVQWTDQKGRFIRLDLSRSSDDRATLTVSSNVSGKTVTKRTDLTTMPPSFACRLHWQVGEETVGTVHFDADSTTAKTEADGGVFRFSADNPPTQWTNRIGIDARGTGSGAFDVLIEDYKITPHDTPSP